MPLLGVENLVLQYGGRVIFEGVTVAVDAKDRIGVVGPNGAGKSTLLRILSGQAEFDGGQLHRTRDVSVGYLAQEVEDEDHPSIRDAVLSGKPQLAALAQSIEDVELQLTQATDVEVQLQLAEQLADLHSHQNETLKSFGPHEADRILLGLGFALEDLERPPEAFSGGWRMRVALAKVLFQQPDILILDEPTNHLDMPSVAWLDSFLRNLNGTLLLTCHDKDFLNRHVSRVFSVELDGVRSFGGNYDAYLAQRDMESMQLEHQIRKDDQRKKELETFINRFKAKASKARQAQSKSKLLEKLEAQQSERPRRRPSMAIRFPPSVRCGDPVISVSQLDFGYGERPIFKGAHASVRRGDRVAIVGRNGTGKTTLLRLLARELSPGGGNIQTGHQVQIGHFAQHHRENLPLHQTILDAVWDVDRNLGQTQVRGLLGAFLFSGDDVEKTIDVLSGGEKARVALARLLLAPGNLLLLDEPTNHLDTESAEKLTESLENYDGTIVFVSHNTHFVRRLANKVWVLENQQIQIFPGSIDDYIRSFEETPNVATSNRKVPAEKQRARPSAKKSSERSPTRGRETDIAELELRIQSLESEQRQVQKALADQSGATAPQQLRTLSTRLEEVDTELEAQLEAWERLQHRPLSSSSVS
jgi:ATP-binding cassette, subfamily F, member 3